MSTEIGMTKNNSFTSFWGGNENGKMVQITGKDGYVEFTMLEAVDAVNILVDFIKEEATRRQELLKKEVEKHKEMEKTELKMSFDFSKGCDASCCTIIRNNNKNIEIVLRTTDDDLVKYLYELEQSSLENALLKQQLTWRDVSEELPEENGSYLIVRVYKNHHLVTEAYFEDGVWFCDGIEIGNEVLKWRLMPKEQS